MVFYCMAIEGATAPQNYHSPLNGGNYGTALKLWFHVRHGYDASLYRSHTVS